MIPIARRTLASFALAGTMVLLAGSAPAAGKKDVYDERKANGQKVRLVAGGGGEVIRGAVTTTTTCGRRFDPFRAHFDFGRPLDRSSRARFRDKGAIVEEDDRFSARYRYAIKGKRKGPHAIRGSFDLEVTFRKDGEEYATCVAREMSFEARNDARG